MKSGNLNFLEISGPLQTCYRTPLPLPINGALKLMYGYTCHLLHKALRICFMLITKISPFVFNHDLLECLPVEAITRM